MKKHFDVNKIERATVGSLRAVGKDQTKITTARGEIIIQTNSEEDAALIDAFIAAALKLDYDLLLTGLNALSR